MAIRLLETNQDEYTCYVYRYTGTSRYMVHGAAFPDAQRTLSAFSK